MSDTLSRIRKAVEFIKAERDLADAEINLKRAAFDFEVLRNKTDPHSYGPEKDAEERLYQAARNYAAIVEQRGKLYGHSLVGRLDDAIRIIEDELGI